MTSLPLLLETTSNLDTQGNLSNNLPIILSPSQNPWQILITLYWIKDEIQLARSMDCWKLIITEPSVLENIFINICLLSFLLIYNLLIIKNSLFRTSKKFLIVLYHSS